MHKFYYPFNIHAHTHTHNGGKIIVFRVLGWKRKVLFHITLNFKIEIYRALSQSFSPSTLVPGLCI